MVYALLVCSETECTDEFEAFGTLEDVDALACECGCALQLISVSDTEPARPDTDLLLQRAA
jgi:hypothetical protein